METFTESTATAFTNAPLETIDLTEWLFTLKYSEYQAFSKVHIECVNSFDSDGMRL